jgi:hypothetical protein
MRLFGRAKQRRADEGAENDEDRAGRWLEEVMTEIDGLGDDPQSVPPAKPAAPEVA